jgi:23S rRNA pseudouridine1911/1915/1917 synthase
MTDEPDALQQTVPEELAGQRLDQALAKMFPQYSRSRIKSWILKGLVTVDGREIRPRDTATGGEAVQLTVQAEVAVTSEPEPLELNLAYEDDDVLVVNKPPGLVVHPGAGNVRGTLLNGLLHYLPQLQDLPRAGIVHRLDKDTSGLLIIGKTLESHTALVRTLAEREISRQYLAVCGGVLTGGGKIDEPIGRHPVDRLRMSVREGGKEAVTYYTVKQRFGAHTYISVRLETGRTHQIRVHFAWRRHPLVGDPVYGGRLALPAGASDEVVQVLRSFRRQALHAVRLSFLQPQTRETIEVNAQPPDDFRNLVAVLGQSKTAHTG